MTRESVDLMNSDTSDFPELVFGLVGPIGVNITSVANKLCGALRQVAYDPHVISVTDLMTKYPVDKETVVGKTSYEQKISHANALRERYGENFLAAVAMGEISRLREVLSSSGASQADAKGAAHTQRPKTAYIIRQLKRHEEVELLTSVYGRKFIQVSATLDRQSREGNLVAKLRKDHPDLEGLADTGRQLIEIDEEEEDDDYGQRVSKAFPTADIFISASDEAAIATTTLRFVEALFGKNSISPTRDEFGAYMAKSASLRSVDLSRQVGAAIFTEEGDIVSVGCNEVPKSGGGNYWFEDVPKARDIDNDAEANKVEISRITQDFLKRLHSKGLLAAGQTPAKVSQEYEELLDKSMLSEITEYGRMTHAEMAAICDAARLGRSVRSTTMYVTTFPCHNCAKHIIAAGIKKLVFIEPYAKSRAVQLHGDSLSVGNHQLGKLHCAHFEGISPKRYRDLFEKGKRRDKDGTIREWVSGKPAPRVDEKDSAHIRREAYATKVVRDRGRS